VGSAVQRVRARMRACGLSGARVGAAKRARGPRVAFWAEVWAVRAGREAEAGRGVAVRSRAEREASWAGERKGRLGCCWAGVGLGFAGFGFGLG